jgi:hypothetical protein
VSQSARYAHSGWELQATPGDWCTQREAKCLPVWCVYLMDVQGHGKVVHEMASRGLRCAAVFACC